MSKQPAKSPRSGPSDVNALSFEEALGEIESIIDRIEAGEIGLEESLKDYERGVLLVHHCRAKLDRSQQQVEDLTRRLEQADNGPSPEDRPGSGGSDDAER